MTGMTATPRRMGAENSKTRLLLLDTAQRLMLEEGYAAVGVRRVAREAEVALPWSSTTSARSTTCSSPC